MFIIDNLQRAIVINSSQILIYILKRPLLTFAGTRSLSAATITAEDPAILWRHLDWTENRLNDNSHRQHVLPLDQFPFF